MTHDAAVATPSIADQIRRTVASGDLHLPPLPEVVIRIQDLLRDEDVDGRRLAEVISAEPALAASVLKVANSAVYGGMSSVTNLQDAVARVGMLQVGATVTAVAHKGHFESARPERRQWLQHLWRHALATAAGARILTHAVEGGGTEAYLAGLLHDIGKLVVLKGVDRLESRRGAPFTDAVVQELVDLLHPTLGHAVLSAWKIPRPVCDVALRHHETEIAETDLLLARVQAANRIARKIGAHPHPDPDMELMAQIEIERLGMSDLEVAALAVDVEDEVAAAMELL